MRKCKITLLFKINILVLVIFTASCGFHKYDNQYLPNKFHKITLNTTDPYGLLSRAIREQLFLNGITILEPNSFYTKKDTLLTKKTRIVNSYNLATVPPNDSEITPSLNIIDSDDTEETFPIFKNGKIAEYQIMVNIHAKVFVDKTHTYPLTVRVYHSFFDNPFNALAKNAEQEMMRKEIRDQAAQQLVRKLKFIYMTIF